jgi:hypothetical protein
VAWAVHGTEAATAVKAPPLARKATQAMEAVKLAVKAMLDAEML